MFARRINNYRLMKRHMMIKLNFETFERLYSIRPTAFAVCRDRASYYCYEEGTTPIYFGIIDTIAYKIWYKREIQHIESRISKIRSAITKHKQCKLERKLKSNKQLSDNMLKNIRVLKSMQLLLASDIKYTSDRINKLGGNKNEKDMSILW